MSKMTPFSYVTSISKSKKYIMSTDKDENNYVPFLINRSLCRYIDCILYVNEINQRYHLTNRMQYEYLLSKIKIGNRYKPWVKSDQTIEEDIAIIMNYYDYSYKKAKEVLPLFDRTILDKLKENMERGKNE